MINLKIISPDKITEIEFNHKLDLLLIEYIENNFAIFDDRSSAFMFDRDRWDYFWRELNNNPLLDKITNININLLTPCNVVYKHPHIIKIVLDNSKSQTSLINWSFE